MTHCRNSMIDWQWNIKDSRPRPRPEPQGQGQGQGLDPQGQGQGQGLNPQGQGQGLKFSASGQGQGQGLTSLITGGVKVVDEVNQFVLGNNDRMEVVEKFCYLGDVTGKWGGAEESSIARVRCAWEKFMDLKMLLTAREASLRVKGKIYRACVQRVLVY